MQAEAARRPGAAHRESVQRGEIRCKAGPKPVQSRSRPVLERTCTRLGPDLGRIRSDRTVSSAFFELGVVGRLGHPALGFGRLRPNDDDRDREIITSSKVINHAISYASELLDFPPLYLDLAQREGAPASNLAELARRIVESASLDLDFTRLGPRVYSGAGRFFSAPTEVGLRR
jgi:hypothetical protein